MFCIYGMMENLVSRNDNGYKFEKRVKVQDQNPNMFV